MSGSKTKFKLSKAALTALRCSTRRRKGNALEWLRARYLILLHRGEDARDICKFLGIREALGVKWRKCYEAEGLASIGMKGYSQRSGHLSPTQEGELGAFLRQNPLRDTNAIRAYILRTYGVRYSRPGCIKLMHRLGFKYKKPKLCPAQADPVDQQAQKTFYETLQKYLPEDEVMYSGDAAHPEHQAKPAHGWFHKDEKPMLPANSGRKRCNIHAALCLDNFDTPFITAETINAESFLKLLKLIQERNPNKRKIHVFVDNARYHHAKIVKAWVESADSRIKLHFLPPYCPHLNPIERLWGVMHKYVTHNRFYPTYDEFAKAILHFLEETVPKEWKDFRDTVTDNFRVIEPEKCNLIQ